jgi:hypothetical protein
MTRCAGEIRSETSLPRYGSGRCSAGPCSSAFLVVPVTSVLAMLAAVIGDLHANQSLSVLSHAERVGQRAFTRSVSCSSSHTRDAVSRRVPARSCGRANQLLCSMCLAAVLASKTHSLTTL